MFLTMNRFKVKLGSVAAFEAVWASRDSHLKGATGFAGFQMLKGPVDEEGGFRLYASHTMWESEDAFVAWTRSEAFRAAHKGAGGHGDLYAGPPKLEVFDSFLSVTP